MSGALLIESRGARPFLALPGLAYSTAVRLRNALYDSGRLPSHRLPCTVISVGNLTVGGTGKTPVTSYLAGMLRESGYRVGVVSRGYKRRAARTARLVSDGRSMLVDAENAGDEPYLIARDNPAVPVAVGADRFAAAWLLMESFSPEVLVLDDAFQHRRLERDIDLVLVDGRDPWGNGRMLPCGPLREPVASIARADACVLTRSDGTVPAAVASALERHNPGAAILHCRLEPRGFVQVDGERVSTVSLKGFAAYAFSGIARPERFEEDLGRLGVRLAGARRFPDHHRFRLQDLRQIATDARRTGADVLLTTEKDLVRILETPEGSLPLYALVIQPAFGPGPGLQDWIHERLAPLRPAPKSLPA